MNSIPKLPGYSLYSFYSGFLKIYQTLESEVPCTEVAFINITGLTISITSLNPPQISAGVSTDLEVIGTGFYTNSLTDSTKFPVVAIGNGVYNPTIDKNDCLRVANYTYMEEYVCNKLRVRVMVPQPSILLINVQNNPTIIPHQSCTSNTLQLRIN
jgi:hypothetical protein